MSFQLHVLFEAFTTLPTDLRPFAKVYGVDMLLIGVTFRKALLAYGARMLLGSPVGGMGG